MRDKKGFYTYIVACADGSLYTGWSTDPERRVREHNAGRGAKYTRTRRPVQLLAAWCFGSKPEAQRFEWEIKQLSRPKKLALIKNQ